MKFILLLFIGSFITVSLDAQVWAVTQKGDTIYVYSDGTWSFDKGEKPIMESEIGFLNKKIALDTIPEEFIVDKRSNKKISSSYGFFDIRYDQDSWKRVPPAQLNEDAEFAFESKKGDIYAAVISEEVEIGTENVYKIAINNIEENLQVTPTIVKSELRTVNGFQVIRGVMEVEISGINFAFDSYYYSNEKGTVQFTTWTSANLHDKYEKQILTMLNGLLIKQLEGK